MTTRIAQNVVLIVHYFPPINSSGAKRMEAMAKYFARTGRTVTVVTTTKGRSDGHFTECFPAGVRVLELTWLGQPKASVAAPEGSQLASGRKSPTRVFKSFVMRWLGQLPDPRLPFAFSFARPLLNPQVQLALRQADVVVATSPPWPPLLAAIFAKARFKKPIILDYRDQLSLCHEMPGGAFAKWMEIKLDRFLASRADAIVAISPPMAKYYADFIPSTTTILNGYDPETIEYAKRNAAWAPREEGTPLTVRYLGLVSDGRIPRALLSAMDILHADGKLPVGSVIFEYYGEPDILRQFVEISHPTLIDFFSFYPRVSYARSLELVVTADHLLFCENSITPKTGETQSAQGILTTKLFEYLASGRPMIAHISPETLAGSFIEKSSGRHFVSDSQQMFESLLMSPDFWRPAGVAENAFVTKLSRVAQADDYLRLIDAVYADAKATEDLLLNAK